jgi:branched-chain amino acid transport system substrate-binding protein
MLPLLRWHPQAWQCAANRWMEWMMTRWFRRGAALAAVMGMAAFTASAPVKAADDIVIGFSVALSGPMQAYDGDSSKMAKLFIEQTNAKGGLLGKKLRAFDADTKSDRAEGAKAGLAAVQAGAVMTFATCDYDYGAPAALQAQRAGIISVFLCAEDPKAGILGVGNLSFTASGAAQLQGAVMAEWALGKKGWKNAYVLLDDSIEYDKSVCAGFDWLYPKKGGTIVGRDNFKNGDASIASQVTRLANAIREKKVEAVMLCTFEPGGAAAVRQIRAAGITVPLLNGSSMDGNYWLNAVPDLKDFYIAVQAAVVGDPRPEVTALAEAFKAKYGALPASQYAFPAYAFMQLWAKAVTETGTTDPKTVVAKLETYTDVPTVLGPRSFSSKYHIQTQIPMMIESVENGADKVIDSQPLSEAIPNDVLYRLKK